MQYILLNKNASHAEQYSKSTSFESHHMHNNIDIEEISYLWICESSCRSWDLPQCSCNGHGSLECQHEGSTSSSHLSLNMFGSFEIWQ